MRLRVFLPTILVLVLISIQAVYAGDNLQRQARKLFAPLPTVFISVENPVTPAKARLGQMLFYDTRLSVDGTVSCAKCHLLSLYATDGLPKAIGNHYKTNPRNAPTLFNAAGQLAEHWIGNRVSVEDQAKQALIGPPSYGLASYADARQKLLAIPGYRALFLQAFPGNPAPENADNFARAVGAWERTLATPSRFDDYLRGDTRALHPDEKAGLQTFITLGCARCHNGALVGGGAYRHFGITQPYATLTHSAEIDPGRFAVTEKEEDRFVFKVSSLRNVAMTAPYFHDGSVSELSRAVEIMAQVQFGQTLTPAQTTSLLAFLKALTGRIPQDVLRVPLLPPSG